MVSSLSRALDLLEIIQSGRLHALFSLASRLDVDERTIRRYIDHLREVGVPIESVRGRYGGYRIAPGYRMPPLMLAPVGLNVFVVSRYAKQPLQEIFAGVWPHVFSHLLLLAVLVAFPSIILWLPAQMAP